MTLTVAAASFGPALKYLYPKGLAEILYPMVPAVGWMPKTTNFVGEAKAIVPHTGGGNGSVGFSSAVNNTSDAIVERFLVTRVKDYAIAKVDGEALMASANDKGAVARALDTQIRSAMYHLSRSAGFQVYSDGSGARATGDGSWTLTGSTVTLADARDIVHFERGMYVDFIDVSSSDATISSTAGTGYITALDRNAGTFTLDVADISAAFSGVAANDKICRRGDNGNCATGFGGWVVGGATPGTLFGLDRNSDPLRLAGMTFTGTSSILEETIIDACAEAMINGAMPDTLFVHPRRAAQLNKSAYAKTLVDVATDVPGIGYKAFEVPTGSGVVKVIPDPNCPYAKGYLLQRDTWELASLGEFPHFAKDDSLKYLREASADAISFRLRAFWNICCNKPGKNMVITW